jgi:uncharacterized repeat protein (TIGR01451 family)
VGNYDLVASQPDQFQLFEQPGLAVTAPTTFNAALAAPATTLGGAVTDTNGNPLPNALVDLFDSQGRPIWSLAADTNGLWSTTQLPPGTYGVKISLLGFFPAIYPSVTVPAGTPVHEATSLAAAGTDDFGQTLAGLNKLLDLTTPSQIYNYLVAHNPAPVSDPRLDIPLPGYDPNCPGAQAAYNRALQDLQASYTFFNNWQVAHENFNATLVSGPVIFSLDMANLVGSVAAVLLAPEATAAYDTLSTGGKVAYNVATIAGPFAANLYNAFANWSANATAVTSSNSGADDVLGGITSLMGTLGSVTAAGYSTAQIQNALLNTPAILKVANPLLAALSTFFDAYSSLQTFLNQINTVTDAKANYDGVVQRYLADRAALGVANANCPQPPPPPPPPPPTPTPGPKQPVPNTHSADPNAKFATGFGLPEWVGPGAAITYTIQFANETNATAPAQTVAITDPLAANLDWSTLQLTDIAFNNVVIAIPPGVQTFSTNVAVSTDPNPVRVTSSLNPATGVVRWLMESIDPVTGQLVTDPLAGFLPPDNKKFQGEGFVTYTIMPKSGLATGVQLTNRAGIVFDVNAAILTPVTTNTMDVTPPTSSVAALPASSPVAIPVKWAGQDAGSGVAGYDLYVSANNGPWTPWLLNTTNNSAVFHGTDFTTYTFYSVAYDFVGNIQTPPGQAQARTTVNEPGFPAFSRQPTNLVAIAGNSAAFVVAAQGAASLQFQWMKGATVLTNSHGKISGATSSTLVISSVSSADAGEYSVRVGNKLGGVTSSNTSLQVVPGITIVAPAGKAFLTNGLVQVTGASTGAAQVLWQVNNSPFQAATGAANWSASVTLQPGTNLFAAKSVAQDGGVSTLATRSFVLDVFQPIAVITNGSGGITGVHNGQYLMVGKNYSVTASPHLGNLFSHWSGTIISASNPLVFQMQSNMVLRANFLTNPFLAVAGNYNGLFYPTNGVTEASSGFLSAAVTSTGADGGAYSAKLLLDGGTNSFGGSFDAAGAARTNLARPGKSSIIVTLQLDFNAADHLLTGSVSNDVASGWVSVIQADRAVFTAKANPATNFAGQFTLILPPGTNAPAGSPAGYGYAAITNTLAGISTLGGALADGTPFLWSTPIAQDGSIPLYQSLYSGRGSLLGWIVFTNAPPQNVSGQVNWIKPANPASALYPSGFTNLSVTGVLGSPYANTTRTGVPVLNLTNGALLLSNGNLLNGSLLFTNIGTNAASHSALTNLDAGTTLGPTNYLAIALNPNNGLITLTFQPTGATNATLAHGAVLQNQTNALGAFPGTNQTGSFLLR